MIAVDTNILVYAHREEMPAHLPAKARLTSLAEGDSPWGLPVFCIGEFVRVVTHPRVLTPPSGLDRALGFIDALIRSPTIRLLGTDDTYWEMFRDIALEARATANLAFDVQLAPLCTLHGATLLTEDRDFARFGIPTSKLEQ